MKFPRKIPKNSSNDCPWNAVQKLYFDSRYSYCYVLEINCLSSETSRTVSRSFRSTFDRYAISGSERKREREISPRIEISSNHFVDPTSNTFTASSVSATVASLHKSAKQRDECDAQTQRKENDVCTCLVECVGTMRRLIKRHLLSERYMKIVSTPGELDEYVAEPRTSNSVLATFKITTWTNRSMNATRDYATLLPRWFDMCYVLIKRIVTKCEKSPMYTLVLLSQRYDTQKSYSW